MINSETFIVKRDGKKEAFSLDKIKNAISKAFLSVGSFATQDVITNILSRVNISDGTSVEDIQNQVEIALMAEHYYSVAKAFMLYRQKHLEDREVRDKLRFLMDYCDASNPATGSKYDANANVENKNIATLIGELPKSNFIRLNRRLLTDRLKDMYGKEPRPSSPTCSPCCGAARSTLLMNTPQNQHGRVWSGSPGRAPWAGSRGWRCR